MVPQSANTTFIRTCSDGKLNNTQCTCLARIAISIMPDIHSQPYSQRLVYGLMERNPLLGFQIIGMCGISNY